MREKGWLVAKKGDPWDVGISDNNQTVKLLEKMRTHPRTKKCTLHKITWIASIDYYYPTGIPCSAGEDKASERARARTQASFHVSLRPHALVAMPMPFVLCVCRHVC